MVTTEKWRISFCVTFRRAGDELPGSPASASTTCRAFGSWVIATGSTTTVASLYFGQRSCYVFRARNCRVHLDRKGISNPNRHTQDARPTQSDGLCSVLQQNSKPPKFAGAESGDVRPPHKHC